MVAVGGTGPFPSLGNDKVVPLGTAASYPSTGGEIVTEWDKASASDWKGGKKWMSKLYVFC